MSNSCKWLHEQLDRMQSFRFSFDPKKLPENGIYFFYEQGEVWGHGGSKPRIVRIGTAREGNFKSRISEHYLLDESKMNFDYMQPAPRERSIFRKNIGRALLSRSDDAYLAIWEIDLTSRKNRTRYAHLRDIAKEKDVEREITKILRANFSFRFIELQDQKERTGREGLESALIGTVAHCKLCRPTENWLGRASPKRQIRESGLWQVQHLKANAISESDKQTILDAIERTKTSSL